MLNELYLDAAPLLDFDAASGEFRWQSAQRVAPAVRGKPAGCKLKDGYVYVCHAGKRLLAHRLAWVKVYGVLPDGQIDHINMDRSDNRIDNLRAASLAENNRNRKAQSNNTSGHKGVTFHKATGKYQAKICVNQRRISLGYYHSAEEAAAAYQQAVKEHHGDFARFK